MAKYVDGFVLVVPKDKTEEYKKMAEEGRDVWIKYGALEYYECRGNDLVPQEMGGVKARAFTEMAGAKVMRQSGFPLLSLNLKSIEVRSMLK